MPQISVVTPSFNQGCYLEETLNSVICQRADVDLQYIVVDGASTDDSQDILRRNADSIDELIMEADDGQAHALSKGFECASGEILAYLNSDDTYLPGALAWVVEYFAQNPKVDALYGHRIFVDATGKVQRFWVLPPHSNYLMRRWAYIPQETCFWRRSVTEKYGGIDASYQFAMDYEMFARVMPHVRFKRVNKFLATFREHGASKTSTLNDTLGLAEVARVRELQKISVGRLDQQLARMLSLGIRNVSALARNWLLTDDHYQRFAP